MSAIESIESKLNEMLVTNAPIQLPENWRKWLATYAWAFALLGVVLGGISILALLPALGILSVASAVVEGSRWLFFSWLAFVVLVGYVVLLGIATPKLKRMEKSGWDLIFYSALFFLAYDVVFWFQSPTFGGVFMLLWNVAWAFVGLYFIFQVRSYFVTKVKTSGPAKPAVKKK